MQWIHRVIALVLAALWLPAVGHCGLEMLEIATEAQGCCSHDDPTAQASPGACVADHCQVFDDGHFRGGEVWTLGVQSPAVAWLSLAMGLFAGDLKPPRVVSQESPPAEEPSVQRWAFERRAAPQANAPGLIAG